jgi:hypothetical protein
MSAFKLALKKFLRNGSIFLCLIFGVYESICCAPVTQYKKSDLLEAVGVIRLH